MTITHFKIMFFLKHNCVLVSGKIIHITSVKKVLLHSLHYGEKNICHISNLWLRCRVTSSVIWTVCEFFKPCPRVKLCRSSYFVRDTLVNFAIVALGNHCVPVHSNSFVGRSKVLPYKIFLYIHNLLYITKRKTYKTVKLNKTLQLALRDSI